MQDWPPVHVEADRPPPFTLVIAVALIGRAGAASRRHGGGCGVVVRIPSVGMLVDDLQLLIVVCVWLLVGDWVGGEVGRTSPLRETLKPGNSYRKSLRS